MEGTLLAGKYELKQKLGEGGHGVVWLAQHTELDVPVAVKFLGDAAERHPELARRFLREARAAARLRSPHVVQVFDYGMEDGRPFIVMEWLRGQTLHERLTRDGRLSPKRCAALLTQVAKAVSLAHDSGIVHRDLKPDNVFLTERVAEGEEEIAKILDFGIAKSTGRELIVSAQTRSGTLLGTPYYMSPEQIAGSENVDHRTDIWALGVIAYECLLGERPVEGESLPGVLLQIASGRMPVPSSVGPVPAGFDAWFARACAAAPDARFGSARDAIQELSALCEGTGTPAEARPDPREKPARTPTLTHVPEARPDEAAAPTLGHASIAPAMSTTRPPQPSLLATRWFVPASVAASVLSVGLVVWIGIAGSSPEPERTPSASNPPPRVEARGAGTASTQPSAGGSVPLIAPIRDTSPGVHPLTLVDAGAPPVETEAPPRPRPDTRRPSGDSRSKPARAGESKKKPAPFEAGF